MRLAALSVDIDEIPCYAAIHGIEVPAGSENAIYDGALPRLARLFSDEKVPVTFFAIGSDLARPENAVALRALAAMGHEIGSHTQHHHYDLTRRGTASIEQEIVLAEEAIERAVGERPVGFRAPGYTITDTVLEVLSRRGYAYDSSVFPCPAYYGLKASAIAAIRLRGRKSQSVLDDPRILTAPADPYRIGTPYTRRGEGLLELPIGVTRGARLPYIGTFITPSEKVARTLSHAMVGRPLVNLELHGIDLADARDDGLGWLAPHQFDLRMGAAAKEGSLRAAIRVLRRAGYAFVTLAEAARAVG